MKYSEKYGQPQGNELVYGADIIRRTDTFEFTLIERFKSSHAAHTAYKQWMDENNLPDNRWKHHLDYKAWNYARPILGLDENGQPITLDSWGVKEMIQCIAFDCFGTVFDMSNISRTEIQDYVDHVNKKDFSPYSFPNSWYALTAHEDSAAGIKLLQDNGYYCVALSNGSYDLIKTISESNNIYWNYIINLNKHKVYKPHFDAYKTIEKDTNFKPTETLMVTANPTFGDIEGAKNINMYSAVIRHGYLNTIPELVDYIQNLENFITSVNQPEKK